MKDQLKLCYDAVVPALLEAVCKADPESAGLCAGCEGGIAFEVGGELTGGLRFTEDGCASSLYGLDETVSFPAEGMLFAALRDASSIENPVLKALLGKAGGYYYGADGEIKSRLHVEAILNMVCALSRRDAKGMELAAKQFPGKLRILIGEVPYADMMLGDGRATLVRGDAANPRAIAYYANFTVAYGVMTRTADRFYYMGNCEYEIRGYMPMNDAYDKLQCYAGKLIG